MTGREQYCRLSSPRAGWAAGNLKRHADYIDLADVPTCWLERTITVDIEAKTKELAVVKLMTELKSVESMIVRLRGKVIVMCALSGLLAACAGERPNNLGVRDDKLSSCPSSPNCVSSQASDERHRIAPLAFNGDPDTAFARLKQILVQRNDTAIIEDKPCYLRTELSTTFFVDDGEFLLDRSRRIINVRSASRLGYSDLGKNRSRMEDIRHAFSLLEMKP